MRVQWLSPCACTSCEMRQHASIANDSFSVRCLPSLTFVDPDDPQITVDQVQDLSALLFWAIVAVGSRETPELYETFVAAHENTMELLRATLGGPKPTYWDVCGAMVWNKYLSPLRPIGGSTLFRFAAVYPHLITRSSSGSSLRTGYSSFFRDAPGQGASIQKRSQKN